jgi:hypothetical protein
MIMKMKYSIISLYIMGMLVMGCSDSYLDINTNPNLPTSANPETVLANALNATAARLSHNEIGAFWSGQWSPSGSVSGFVPEKTYDIQTTFRPAIWTGTYDVLTDIKYVEEQSLKQGKKSLAGIARVMKAYNFQTLVDAFGNIPYSEALKGTAVIRPKYDPAGAVYDSLIRDLNVAITYLSEPISASNPSAGSADIYFGGVTSTWIKFANTLKLRMLVRLSGVSDQQQFVAEQLATLGSSSSVFLGAGENVKCNPGYLKTTGKENPFYENYGYSSADSRAGNHDFYAWSNFFITTVQGLNDPRISLLAYPAGGTGTNYLGVPFGDGNDAYLYSKISGFGPAFLPTDGSVKTSNLYKGDLLIMTSAESYLLQAEAVLRGLLTSDLSAQVLYEKGVRESFDLLSRQSDSNPNMVPAFNAYITNGRANADWNASPDKIRAIITQKWIALANFSGFEAWTEFRRTGIPSVPLSTRAASTKMPVRLLYPNSEYSNNPENVAAQGQINQYDSKIFWDVN